MESIIKSAIEHVGEEEEEEQFTGAGGGEFSDLTGTPRIVIVGCGGAGNNTINRLHQIGVRGAETVAINTDKQHLDMIEADKKLLIGKSVTRGLGAGGYPDVAERCAEMAQGQIESLLDGADLVFITAGMGGGTGTGTAPVVADIAKQQGAIVIGMVSTPFNVERARIQKGEEGLERLRKEADTVIVLDNNRLLDYVPNLPIDQAFSVMDQLISETVKGLSETITQPSLINLDYADVKTIMGCGGVAVMLYGESKAQDSSKVIKEALNHPLLDVDYRGATGALVHMTGGPDLTLRSSENIAQGLTMELESQANVIWGARIDPEYEGRVRVMAIMTGVESANVLGSDSPQGSNRQSAEGAKTTGPEEVSQSTTKDGMEITWIK